MTAQADKLVPAKQASYAATLSPTTATDVTVAYNQIVELNAGDSAVYAAWGRDASATDFDMYVASGAVRQYAVPVGCTVMSVISAGDVVTIVY